MERKKDWFSSVKKAFRPESKEKKAQKWKKKLFGKGKTTVPDAPHAEAVTFHHSLPPPKAAKLTGVETEQTIHDYSSEVAMAAEAAAIAESQSDAVVVELTSVTQFTGIAKEEASAIKIQKAFRGYQLIFRTESLYCGCEVEEVVKMLGIGKHREGGVMLGLGTAGVASEASVFFKARRALRGLVRLKSLVQGPPAKRQTANALRCMQTLARVQSQIQSRRIRMSEENQALQRQLLQKRAKELSNLQIAEKWDESLQSKEQIEANLLCKYEAAMRRERAMAYSFSHQKTQKKSTRPATLMFMDPNNPYWGWSWLERWMAESQGTNEKEQHSHQSPTNNPSLNLSGGEITKSFARHQLNSKKPSSNSSPKKSRPFNHHSTATPPSVARKLKAESPRENLVNPDRDGKSIFSMKSGKNRRHSIGGPLQVRDDESLGSSPRFPSYMAQTQSAKTKSRMQSLLDLENGTTPEKGSAGSAKKQLSFPSSPARPRRHSGPPIVEVVSLGGHSVRNGPPSLLSLSKRHRENKKI